MGTFEGPGQADAADGERGAALRARAGCPTARRPSTRRSCSAPAARSRSCARSRCSGRDPRSRRPSTVSAVSEVDDAARRSSSRPRPTLACAASCDGGRALAARAPALPADVLAALRGRDEDDLNPLEAAFLDPVPGRNGPTAASRASWRAGCARRSRRAIPRSYRASTTAPPTCTGARRTRDPNAARTATRYLSHRFEARNWDALVRGWTSTPPSSRWCGACGWPPARSSPRGPHSSGWRSHVARTTWRAAATGTRTRATRSRCLAGASDVDVRVWTALQRDRGPGAARPVRRRRRLLADRCRRRASRGCVAEAALASAAIARWRGSAREAERLVTEEVSGTLAIGGTVSDTARVRARARCGPG
jgi:hypothetical protein